VAPRELQGFVAELAKNGAKRDAVSGNLLFTLKDKGKDVTFPAVLLVAFPDKLRLELQDPVGGILVLLVLEGDRFWVYQRDRAEILTGPLKSLPASLQISSFDAIREFLARPDGDHLARSELRAGEAVFRGPNGVVETVRWTDGFAEPSEWATRHAGRESSARYEDYEFKEGVRYPTKIRLAGSDSAGKHEALLVWKDWAPGVPKEKKLFQIPQQETFGRKIKVLR
jgi:hypothetical protein